MNNDLEIKSIKIFFYWYWILYFAGFVLYLKFKNDLFFILPLFISLTYIVLTTYYTIYKKQILAGGIFWGTIIYGSRKGLTDKLKKKANIWGTVDILSMSILTTVLVILFKSL